MRRSEAGKSVSGFRRSRFAFRSASPAFVLLLASLLVAASDRPAAAQSAKPPGLVGVEVGLGGNYRLGFWTPVTVTLRGGDERVIGTVELSAVDGNDVPVNYRSSPVQLLPGRDTSTTVYLRLGAHRELGIVLRGDSGVLLTAKLGTDSFDGALSLPAPKSSDARLIVAIGPNPTLTGLRFGDRQGNNDLPPIVVPYDSPARLPTRYLGYDAVDCVVIRADQLSRYAALPKDAPQWSALRTWVEQGGKLVIVAGRDVETLLAAGGPLAPLFPVKSDGMIPLPRTTELENAAGNRRRLELDADTLAELRVLRIQETDGDVEVAEGDLPLIVRRAVGLGRITFAAFDLEHRALADWSPRERLLKQMIETAGISGGSDESPHVRGRYGYDDLTGQLLAAIDQYEGVQVISFFTLAMLVIGYIALVGPGDYFLVRKLLKRTELTWVTLPAIVVLTTVGAHYLALWMKGDQLCTNQVDVVDCDAASGVVRGVSYAGVFSPSTTNYDVGWRPSQKLFGAPPDDPDLVTTCLGGDGLGGIKAREVAGDWFGDSYNASGDLATLSGMPVQVWSSKMVTGRWSARAPKPLHPPLVRQGERLAGTVRNPFPTVLADTWLFHGRDAYNLGNLKPEATFELKNPLSRGLRSVLNDTKVAESTKQYQTPRTSSQPYDPGSLDVANTLRHMMFFEAAGGRGHTGLTHRYQKFLDAGELLALNRAILVARVDDAAQYGSELTLSADGAPAPRNRDRRYMVVRLVIPVETAAP